MLGDRFARAVAYLLNPLVLPVLLIGAVLFEHGAPMAELGRVTAVLLALLTLVPAALLGWMVSRGRLSSIEVPERSERAVPYSIGICCTAAAAFAIPFLAVTAKPLVTGIAACVAVNTALLALINRRWKISIHAAAMAGVLSVLVFAAAVGRAVPAFLVFCLLGLPLVIWSRIRSGAHTPGEVLAGTLFGLAAPFAELHVLLAAGLLELG